MIRLWEFLFHGCWHQWRVQTQNDLLRPGKEIPYGTRYTYQCEKCHRIKKQDIE